MHSIKLFGLIEGRFIVTPFFLIVCFKYGGVLTRSFLRITVVRREGRGFANGYCLLLMHASVFMSYVFCRKKIGTFTSVTNPSSSDSSGRQRPALQNKLFFYFQGPNFSKNVLALYKKF